MHPAAVALPARRPLFAAISLPLMVAVFLMLWSSAFSVAKLAIADCPPLLLLAARFLIASVLMFGIAAISGVRWTLGRRDILLFALLGIANQAIYLGVGYVALRDVSAGLAVLIFSANPIVTAVFAALVLGERMTWSKAAGLVLGIAGVAFIVQSRLSIGSDHLRGILLTVVSLLSFVGGTILFKRYAPKDGLWIGNGVQSLAAGIALLPFSLATESIGDITPTWRLLASFAFLVVLVSVFAYLLWFKILTVSGATAASSYYFLLPPLGVLFGWLLLGEHVALNDMLWNHSGRARHLSRHAAGPSSHLKRLETQHGEIIMSTPRFTLIGGPTVLIEYSGFRLLTDPTFDEPGEYKLPQVTLTKTHAPGSLHRGCRAGRCDPAQSRSACRQSRQCRPGIPEQGAARVHDGRWCEETRRAR